MSRNYKTKIGVQWGSLALASTNLSDKAETQLRVRRVKPSDEPEHVQVEVEIVRVGAMRRASYHGYIQLDAKQAKALATAVSKVQPDYDRDSPLAGLQADSDKAWAEFYGIDPKDMARFL
jgi:hypothetical protein